MDSDKLIIKNYIYNELDLIKCEYCIENILILDCSFNFIVKILNYPPKLEEFNCSANRIKYLENLPNTLKYLDCYSNPIENLDNLPESLLLLRCSHCILPLNNLPIGLLDLDCESCILDLSTLSNLKFFRGVCCNSETSYYQTIPKNMCKLILDNCDTIKINFNTVPQSLSYIYCSRTNYKNHIYNLETLDKNVNEFKKDFSHVLL
jgi:hypothetical protein